LVYENGEGYEMSIDCAVDFITDLAALLLECKVSGGLDTRELEMDQLKVLRIPAEEKELAVVRKALDAFIANPLGCELADMVPEEDLREMAALCGELREEL
jgi:uroporphyrinogen-III decarboxylase